MFQFPPQSLLKRTIPKTKFYSNATISRTLQKKFVDEIDRIVWSHKLAPESIHLPTRGTILEIQVFHILLKGEGLSQDVLRAIDQSIRHPIFYRIESGTRCRYAACHKRPHETDASRWVLSDYFYSDWVPRDSAFPPLPTALDLEKLWDQMLRQLLPPHAPESVPLNDTLQLLAEKQKILREIARLQNRIAQEKHFNRKVEWNQELRRLQHKLEHEF